MIASAALFLAVATAGDAPDSAVVAGPVPLLTESVQEVGAPAAPSPTGSLPAGSATESARLARDDRWSGADWVVLGALPVAVVGASLADESVRDFAQDHRSAPTRLLAHVGNGIGDGRLVLPAVGLVAWASWSGRAPRLARASVNAIEAWTLTQVVAQTGKYTIGRARPDMDEGNTSFHGVQIARDRFHSFPSGHTSTAWGILPAYAMEFGDDPWIAGGLYTAASLTALSRIHDDHHWLSDVVAAAGIGWLSNRAVRSWNARPQGEKSASVALAPLPGGWMLRATADF